MTRARRLVLGGLIGVLAASAGITAYRLCGHRPSVTDAVPAPAPHPSAAPPPVARRPAGPALSPTVETSYMDVIRSAYPSLPTTQPLALPLELGQAARFVLNDPVYLDKVRGDLWITRTDAPPMQAVLRQTLDPNAPDPQTHVLSERVVFVHWMVNTAGVAQPYVVCHAADGGFDVAWIGGRKPLPTRREYRWDRAFSWDGAIVVPTRTGVDVLQVRPELKEAYRELIPPGDTTSKPRVLPDAQGLLAWVPPTASQLGSRGAARYLAGGWGDLGPDQGWPARVVQLVPLRDGTVFQFVPDAGGSVALRSASLEQTPVDPKAIDASIARLNDDDPVVRRSAFGELADDGPGAWAEMTRRLPDQPPQAQLLLRQLLKDKSRPTLGGMTLLGDRLLQIVGRLSDGGIVFCAPQGVSIPDADGEPSTVAPAYLSIRPGRTVELLPAALVADLKVGRSRLDIVGDQWILNTDSRGPRLFFGNGFATLLRKDERSFSLPVGIDQLGRWLFRRPADDQAGLHRPTLVIDPHLPDPTPRLPVWQLAIANEVGWDKNDWPVLKNGGAFALGPSDWRPLTPDEPFFTHLDRQPPATAPALHASALHASDRSNNDPGPTLLVAADGTRYAGGLTGLHVTRPDGSDVDWPLPPAAQGVGPVSLVRTADGKLFLFNQPGRVLRIAPTPRGAEPFKLEATFTHNIPAVSHPTRIWLDPAGRIDIEWEKSLAILFPAGYVPRGISDKMTDQNGLDADGL